MLHRKEQTLGEVLQEFFSENKALQNRMAEMRALRGWHELFAATAARYTRNVYVKNGTLYLFLTSAIFRSELLLHRDQLIRRLNDYVGTEVIRDIVIH